MDIVELYFGVAGLLMIVLATLCLKNKRRIDGDDIHNILGLAGLWPFLVLGLFIGLIDWVKNMRKLKGGGDGKWHSCPVVVADAPYYKRAPE